MHRQKHKEPKMNAEMRAKNQLEKKLQEEARRTGRPAPEVVSLDCQYWAGGYEQFCFRVITDAESYFPRSFKVTVYTNSYRIVEI